MCVLFAMVAEGILLLNLACKPLCGGAPCHNTQYGMTVNHVLGVLIRPSSFPLSDIDPHAE